ncbi:HAD-like domain-containing protein [Cladorrhinum sp. PSN259]|nr:HAD-like domain-containing protein [Cladorrhinum sp. PSN259]
MQNIILFDFDGTITAHDTINVLASLATSRNPQTAPLWENIVREYVADHAKHLKTYRPEACDRTTLAQELEFLQSLGKVEQKSVGRVGGLGVFATISGEDFKAFGEKVVRKHEGDENGKGGTALHEDEPRVDGEAKGEDDGKVMIRKGFGKFADKVKERGWEFGVVSINWSREFIEGVLSREGLEGSGSRIKANGIIWPGGKVEGYEDGNGRKALMTVEDKVRAMRDLVGEIRGGGGEGGGKVVYFGDSPTDMGCLLEADLGVVVADEDGSKLLETLRRIGLEVPHVKDFTGGERLVWSRDFEEVLRSAVIESLEGK